MIEGNIYLHSFLDKVNIPCFKHVKQIVKFFILYLLLHLTSQSSNKSTH